MKIEGSQMGSNGVHSSGLNSGGDDSISKSLKKQIENVQNEIKSLSANKDMPPKEKQERSKQLRQELAELKRQLSQHQIEKQKEQREQRMQKTTEIKLDGGRGQDTSLKQESLEKTEDKIASLDSPVKVQAGEAAEERDEKDIQETERKTISYKKINILL